MNSFIKKICIIITLSLLCCCITTVNYSSRWYGHYGRALSSIEKQSYDDAILYLEEALKTQDKDERFKETYGLHFIDYFPHREKGIIFYKLSNYKEAKIELERSIKDEYSAKARFYLDLVKKKIIIDDGSKLTYPKIRLDDYKKELWTSNNKIIISGVAEDEEYIREIYINNEPLLLKNSDQFVNFKKHIELTYGQHTILIKAKNLMDRTSFKKLSINVDNAGPLITVDRFDIINNNKVEISGLIYDEAKISKLTINDKQVQIKHDKVVPFTQILEISSIIFIEAIDKINNKTIGRIRLKDITAHSISPTLLANASNNFYFHQKQLTLKKNLVWLLNSKPIYENILFSSSKEVKPTLKLKDDKFEVIKSTKLSEIYINGFISNINPNDIVIEYQFDNSFFESGDDTNYYSRYRNKYFFGKTFEIIGKSGERPITMTVKYKSKPQIIKTISVFNKVPDFYDEKNRLSMKIINNNNRTTSLFLQITNFHSSNRFKKANKLDELNNILEESIENLKRFNLKTDDPECTLTWNIQTTGDGLEFGGIIKYDIYSAMSKESYSKKTKQIKKEIDDDFYYIDVYSDIDVLYADKNDIINIAKSAALQINNKFIVQHGKIEKCIDNSVYTNIKLERFGYQKKIIIYEKGHRKAIAFINNSTKTSYAEAIVDEPSPGFLEKDCNNYMFRTK